MKRSKQTKRALTSSVLALVLCFVMLLGTTFAWFTDNASTNVNKVQAGKLDVALEMYENGEWVSAEGKTLDFVKATGHENEEILWEPNATYKLPTVRIVNKGNLALKYMVVVSAVGGDSKLAEVIDVIYSDTGKQITEKTVGTLSAIINSTDSDGFAHGNLGANAESGEITLSLHMQEGAGNKYQGLSISGIAITAYATQDTVEYDSNDNKYDEGAVLDPAAADFVNWFKSIGTVAGQQEYTYTLTEDIDLSGIELPKFDLGNDIAHSITIDGNGHTIKNLNTTNYGYSTDSGKWHQMAMFGRIKAFNTVTIKNLTCDGWFAGSEGHYKTGHVGLLAGEVYGTLNVEDVTVKNSTVYGNQKVGGLVGAAYNGSKVTISGLKTENVTVNGALETAKLIGSILRNGGSTATPTVSYSSVYTDGITVKFWEYAIEADCGTTDTYDLFDNEGDSCVVFNKGKTGAFILPTATDKYAWNAIGTNWTYEELNSNSYSTSENISG